ncbi:acetyl-CoA acetyltransferase, cytosolic 1-like [Impatiens glandulifera]|uniref:acetyl-CoA acetyltransferase, cytosolic 1-like n=1 Tax=Impatiens glandulifera TaxID=253017 RepID=UPI001FB0904A|nr:acetyl-CoA acetyltransferase, cytosolic 1-like [Impatiens glandulifera]
MDPTTIKPRDVCIVGVARTPMGRFNGSLRTLTATKLGSIAIQSALERANVDPSLVQEVFFGNVLSVSFGNDPARESAIEAGIPDTVVCTTINKVCASGMKAIMLAAQSIQLGINDVVVAGGMESMSNNLNYEPKFQVVFVEECVKEYSISREDQDNYVIQSFKRSFAAQENGVFALEITPVEVSGDSEGPSTIVNKDEGLGKFDAARLRNLKPISSKGTITTGNTASLRDGAAALVLVSGDKALKLGLLVIAKITGYADAAQNPIFFTTAPALAIPKAISNAGLKSSQIDFYEINEAYAVVPISNMKLLQLDPAKVNVHGGALSLGHPIGCSGARILVALLGVLKKKNGKYGVGGVSNIGGGASALVVEMV